MSRRREAELMREVAVYREALEQSEHALLLDRIQSLDDFAYWKQMALDERRLREAAEVQRDSAEVNRAIAQCNRDLLLESSRCLPVLDGDNAWQATGPAPIYDELRAS